MAFVCALIVMACGSLFQQYGLFIVGALLCCTTGGAYLSYRKGGKPHKGAWTAFKLSSGFVGAGVVVFVLTVMTR